MTKFLVQTMLVVNDSTLKLVYFMKKTILGCKPPLLGSDLLFDFFLLF
jgi:hypothetical protein